jgi:hypothetical protein
MDAAADEVGGGTFERSTISLLFFHRLARPSLSLTETIRCRTGGLQPDPAHTGSDPHEAAPVLLAEEAARIRPSVVKALDVGGVLTQAGSGQGWRGRQRSDPEWSRPAGSAAHGDLPAWDRRVAAALRAAA